MEEKKKELATKRKEAEKFTGKILKLDHDISINRKHIASVCAKARNEYSKAQIKKRF